MKSSDRVIREKMIHVSLRLISHAVNTKPKIPTMKSLIFAQCIIFSYDPSNMDLCYSLRYQKTLIEQNYIKRTLCAALYIRFYTKLAIIGRSIVLKALNKVIPNHVF